MLNLILTAQKSNTFFTFRNTNNCATILNMDENPAYGTKTSLRGQAYENTPEEPSYEIIPAVSSQPPHIHEHTTAQ